VIEKKNLLIRLEFDNIPPGLNAYLRMNHKARHRLGKEWESKLVVEAMCKHPAKPSKGEKRVVVFRCRSSRPRDFSNAIGSFNKLITDKLLVSVVRNVKGLGKMKVPGQLPFLYDDDIAHVHEEYDWQSIKGQKVPVFVVEVWST